MSRSLLLFSVFIVIFVTQALSQPKTPVLNVPLYGDFNTYFMYYTNVTVGTPGNMYTVIIDTGSADLLIPNASCDSCAGDSATFYNVASSSTGAMIHCSDSEYHCTACALPQQQCVFTTGYVGITETAALTTDIASILNSPIPSLATFGAILNISMGSNGNFLMKKRIAAQSGFYPEGMWGMGRQSLSSSGAVPYMDLIIADNSLADVFSHCLAASGKGGLLTIGAPSPYLAGPLQYTPLTAPRFYEVKMMDLLVSGKSIGLHPDVYNTKHCIVDSGTATPTLPVKAFSAIAKLLMATCSSSQPLKGICAMPKGQSLLDGKCVSMTASDIAAFPMLTFILDGKVKLNYPPQQYLRNMYFCDDGSSIGLAFSADPSGFGTVLGMTLLQQYVTVYDRAQNRIGFGSVKACPEN